MTLNRAEVTSVTALSHPSVYADSKLRLVMDLEARPAASSTTVSRGPSSVPFSMGTAAIAPPAGENLAAFRSMKLQLGSARRLLGAA